MPPSPVGWRRWTCLAALFVLWLPLVSSCGSGGVVLADAGADATPPDAAPEIPPTLCAIALDCSGVDIPDEPKITCSLEIDDGDGNLLYSGVAGVEVRGRSSLSFPKKQYSVELRHPGGVENPTDLLGMGVESDWIINGAYIDRSLFRNKLLYELFQQFGGRERYAAELRYCELTLEGDWLGIYLLTERIKRDDDRIAIPADTALNGSSFLLKQDEEGFHELGFGHGSWRTVYPHEDRVLPAQAAGISAYLDAWEAAVGGGGDIFAAVDLDSAVDFVLVHEFAKNNDAYYLSVHIWKQPGSLIHFTPWDLDLAFGQPLYNESADPHGWVFHRPRMIAAMAAQPAFQQRLAERWAELRAGVLADTAIFARIDFHLDTVADHVGANFERWPIEEIQFLDDQLYPVSSYAEEVSLVRAWIEERLRWMDANIGSYTVH